MLLKYSKEAVQLLRTVNLDNTQRQLHSNSQPKTVRKRAMIQLAPGATLSRLVACKSSSCYPNPGTALLGEFLEARLGCTRLELNANELNLSSTHQTKTVYLGLPGLVVTIQAYHSSQVRSW
jgi:hypothetical protein